MRGDRGTDAQGWATVSTTLLSYYFSYDDPTLDCIGIQIASIDASVGECTPVLDTAEFQVAIVYWM